MFLNTDYIEPAELTGFARAALEDAEATNYTLSQYLPSVFVDDLEFRFDSQNADALVDVATYRAYDTESPLARRPGIGPRRSGELPPISRKIRVSEYDRLRQRKLEAAIGDQIEGDAARLVREVGARVEIARAQALFEGRVVLEENGVSAAVDFGRSADNTVTADALWSGTGFEDGTIDPVVDLLEWVEDYTNRNGVEPGVILTSGRVRARLQRSAALRAYAGTERPLLTRADVDSVLQDMGIPTIRTNDSRTSLGRVTPENDLLLLPGQGSVGGTLYGAPAESREPEYGLQGNEPGIVAGVFRQLDPVGLWVHVSGIVLPIVHSPDLTYRVTVL